MQNKTYTEFVKVMVAKCDLYKKGKDLLQTLAKKIANPVYGGNIRRDVNDQYKRVTKNWMKENYDYRVKERRPMKNGNLIVKLEDDVGVDGQDITKSINQIPCHLGSYILGHSERRMNHVIREIDSLYSNNIYYGDMDSSYIPEKHWSMLVDNDFHGKSL